VALDNAEALEQKRPTRKETQGGALSRIRTLVCADCLRPLRLWHRRVSLTRRRVVHRSCWEHRQTAKEMVATQIIKR
jgi:hypothetical protein